MYLFATIPAIILFIVIWRLDNTEKEPAGLLIKLFWGGALTVISAVLAGLLGDKLLGLFYKGTKPLLFIFIDSFIFSALVQEAGKFFVLKRITWKNREFNYTFDGVVYAVSVSLGYTVLENIVYAVAGGGDASIMRVILSATGHILFAVFMGYFYGLARYTGGAGDIKAERRYIAEAFFVPVFLNGFYIFCLKCDNIVFTVLLAVYEVILLVVGVWRFIKLSREDMIIPGMEWTTLKEDDKTWEVGDDEGKM